MSLVSVEGHLEGAPWQRDQSQRGSGSKRAQDPRLDIRLRRKRRLMVGPRVAGRRRKTAQRRQMMRDGQSMMNTLQQMTLQGETMMGDGQAMMGDGQAMMDGASGM